MTGILTPQGITVRKGDSFNILLQFKHQNAPMDLLGCAIKMTVRDNSNQEKFTTVGEIIDRKEGKARIKLLPANTNLLPADYKTDIQIIFKNGEIHTIYPQNINSVAFFRVTDQVTE